MAGTRKRSGCAPGSTPASTRRAARSSPAPRRASRPSPAIACPACPAAAQMMQLDLAGIAVSAGSACSSGSLKTSHVLTAMGMAEEEAREVIRVSFGPHDRRERHRRLARRMAHALRAPPRRVTIYLDYQATTPLAPEARGGDAALARGEVRQSAQPAPARPRGRGGGRGGARAGARRRSAAASGRLYFTSGATEAANWALKGAAAPARAIVTLATEHACVLDTVEWLARQGLRGRHPAGRRRTASSTSTSSTERVDRAAPASSPRCWSTTRSA